MIRNCFFQQFKKKNSTIKDVLLDIGNSIPSFVFTRALCNQADYKRMMENCSFSVLCTLDNCCEENETTEQIHILNWPTNQDVGMITYKSNTGTLSAEELNADIEEKYSENSCWRRFCRRQDVTLVSIPVDVRVIYMDWFYRSDPAESFIDFATIMNGKREEIYATEFVRVVLD